MFNIGTLLESVHNVSIADVNDVVTWLYDSHAREYSLRNNLQSRHIRKFGPRSTNRVDPLSTRYRTTERCIKNQLILLRTLGEEVFGLTLLRTVR